MPTACLSARSALILGLWLGCGSACATVEPTPYVRPTLNGALSALPDRSVNQGALSWSEYRGQVVMVSFVATWCFPCVADLPVMEKLQQEFGSQGYRTIAVGMDLEGPKVLRPFADAYALQYPLVWASDEVRNGSTVFGRIRELPTRFVFDRDGELALAFSGVADPSGLIAAVKRVVEQKPTSWVPPSRRAP